METKRPGEFELIGRIKDLFSSVPTPGSEGIGDDCAIIPINDDESYVVTTDMLVEDIHFLRDRISPCSLGRKSLAVNLSDIAAMGAAPFASFLSVALPASVSGEWIDGFLKGYHSLSEEFSIPLLGGDTTGSVDRITINVTVIGRIKNQNIKRRCGAKIEDKILVTGFLGDSSQGLLDIKSGAENSEFSTIHNNPIPLVNEGMWFGKQPEVHAMMDLSDGLASDLTHILKASNVSAVVDIERIPTRTSIELAVTGGEDYQLLITVAAASLERIQKMYEVRFGTSLVEIGTILAGDPLIHWREENSDIFPEWKGFTHF